MWLTNLAIRRPVFVLMMVSALIVLGWNSRGKMSLELNPKVDFPMIAVLTVYPGAGPQEIESEVAKRIEDAVASVNGVKTISSTSQEGIATVTIEFNVGVSSDIAASDVREKVAAVRESLPEECRDPIVLKFDINSMPIIYYGVTGTRPSRDVRDITDNIIKPRLSKIPGVAAVTVSGGDVREIRVAVRKERLDAYNIGIQQVAAAVRANTLNFPAGHVIEGNREYSVRLVGEYRDMEMISRTRIRMPDGRTVPLSEIADVHDTIAEPRTGSRINQQDSVAIVIQKTSEGNTVDIAHNVRSEIAQLQKELPRDIRFVLNNDLSVNVEHSVDDVVMSLVLGALLAVLVVFLFLHNLRGTMIVGIAIPTSVFATFLPMYAFGFTLNTMTLLALSLSVGILVDDSIVVLENIYRHLTRGEQPIEAAINGRGEIGLAAVTITLVDVVVFVPIAFMGGIVGQFFKAFGLTIATATLFSLLMSFTLTPLLAARWYRAGEAVEAHHGFFGMINRIYAALDRLYRKILEWALRYRGVVVYIGSGLLILVVLAIAASIAGPAIAGSLVTLAVLFGVFGLIFMWRYRVLGLIITGAGIASVFIAYGIGIGAGRPLLNFRFAPDQDQGTITIDGELPAGTSLKRTREIVMGLEDTVASVPDVQNIFTNLGSTQTGMAGAGSSGTQYFSLTLRLKDKMSLAEAVNPFAKKSNLRRQPATAVADEVRKKVGVLPGVTLKVAAVSGFRGGSSPMQIDLLGNDIGAMTSLAMRIRDVFRATPGIINADITTRIGRPEERVIIDRDRAASFGLTVSQIALALRTALEGDDSTVYREGGNEYKIRVQLGEQYRKATAEIETIVVGYVADAKGLLQPVRLSEVARVFLAEGPTKVDRMDRQRLVSVTADTLPGYAPGNLRLDIEKRIEDSKLDFGSTAWRWGGETRVQDEEAGYMMGALTLSIILVYMLMAALFDNLLYPLIIMISLPQAMVGALIGLMVANHALTIVAMIGIIMLVGLVTKNAILLVDYTNTLRARGRSRNDAILEAGPTRLRPILMTTSAMICGMLPTALGLGRGAEFRAPLATPVIGGLILSTLLTLVVIPCVYTYFDDAAQIIGRLMHRLQHRSRS